MSGFRRPCEVLAKPHRIVCVAESALLDELSYKLGIDPIELRLRNYAETDL